MQNRDTVARLALHRIRQQICALLRIGQRKSVATVIVSGADGIVNIIYLLLHQQFQHVCTVTIKSRHIYCTRQRYGTRIGRQIVETMCIVCFPLTDCIVENHIVAIVDNHLRIYGGAVLAIAVIHEYRHRHWISAALGIVVCEMYPIVIVITVAEVPHHAVALVIDCGIKGNILVNAEVIILQFSAEDIDA